MSAAALGRFGRRTSWGYRRARLMGCVLDAGFVSRGVPGPETSSTVVEAAGQRRLAVGAERDGPHLVGVLHWWTERLARRGVPEPGRPVEAAGQQGLAVGRERDGAHRAGVLERFTDGLAGGGVPDAG